MPGNKKPRRKGSSGKRTPKPKTPADEPVNGVQVQVGEDGDFVMAPLGNVKPREVPTLLRQAAAAADKALGVST